MTREEMEQLIPGDIVRHVTQSDGYVVAVNYNDRVSVVRVMEITNPCEWDIVRRNGPENRQGL